jgi:hypothetical protein
VADPDAAHYADLVLSLSALDPWLARMDLRALIARPSVGSAMASDDQRLNPYQISHAAWSSLSHAVDHLECMRALVRDVRVIHRYAPYTLLRAGLENACCAVWMLQPSSRRERITRRLRLAVNDIEQGEAAREITKQKGPRTKGERLQQVSEIARLHGVDASPRPVGYGRIVESVGDADKVVLLAWKTCSGQAHGDLWSQVAGARMTELPGASVDIGSFAVTANVGLLEQMTAITLAMITQGWTLYDQRCRSPWLT